MEVEGQLVTMATGDFGCPGQQHYTKVAKAERRIELALRRQRMEDSLQRKLRELRTLCLQEAELTGRVPKEYPLEPGEEPPSVGWRAATACRALEPGYLRRATRLRDLQRRSQLQERSAVSAHALGTRADGQRGRCVRRHGHSLHSRPGDPTMETVLADNPGGARGYGETIGRGEGWTLLPTDVYHPTRIRRNSYASPVRMLQRSMSGAGRHSEPSSPMVHRDRAARHRYPTPGPCAGGDPLLDPGSEAGAERVSAAAGGGTRRSSSSEALGGAWRGSLGTAGLRLAAGRWAERPRPPGPGARRPDREQALHRALALEGLRDWYVRAAGQPRRHVNAGMDRLSFSHRGAAMDWWTPAGLSQGAGVTARGRWC